MPMAMPIVLIYCASYGLGPGHISASWYCYILCAHCIYCVGLIVLLQHLDLWLLTNVVRYAERLVI